MLGCFGLVFTIVTIPVQNFDALCKCHIFLLGENRNWAVLLLNRSLVCVFWAFGCSALSSSHKLGKYQMYVFVSFLLPCRYHLQPHATSPQAPFVHHPALQSLVHSLGHSPRPPGPAVHGSNWHHGQANPHLLLKLASSLQV